MKLCKKNLIPEEYDCSYTCPKVSKDKKEDQMSLNRLVSKISETFISHVAVFCLDFFKLDFHYQQQCFVTLCCASLILSVHLMISKNFEKSKD